MNARLYSHAFDWTHSSFHAAPPLFSKLPLQVGGEETSLRVGQMGVLLNDPRDNARRDRSPSLSNIEALPVLDGDGIVYIAHHLNIVARHHHFRFAVLGTFGPVEGGGLVYDGEEIMH